MIAPTAVQGDAAPVEIVAALEKLNAQPGMDVILIGRGGGSLEDLWAFNDERVVRAVVASRVPVISGVGHETDFTLVDFAADLRAPTPTAAAELATPDRTELTARVYQLNQELNDAMQARVALEGTRLAEKQKYLLTSSPLRTVKDRQQRLDEMTSRTHLAALGLLRHARSNFTGMSQLLSSLNPEAVLQRGYAIVRAPGGVVIRKVEQAIPQSRVSIKVSDGEFTARVAGANEGEDA
jgi:exodeoxyribonuclease VII large subunit